MKDSKVSHPIYVAVDVTKLARCKWCGRMEGGQWLLANSRRYCSRECSQADSALVLVSIYVICAAAVPFLSILRGDSLIMAAVLSLTMMAIGSPVLWFSYLGFQYQSKVPRGSKGNEGPSVVDLLKALPSRVSCPNCDASIDLENVSDDMVYTCEYCGASGNIEILKQD